MDNNGSGAAERQAVKVSWNNFSSNLRQSAEVFRNRFTDVILAAENKQIETHRFILASGSEFFRKILDNEPMNTKKYIYLFGIRYDDLISFLDFMYTGEVIIEEARLNNFILAAKQLEIKGLVNDYTPTQSPTKEKDDDVGVKDIEVPPKQVEKSVAQDNNQKEKEGKTQENETENDNSAKDVTEPTEEEAGNKNKETLEEDSNTDSCLNAKCCHNDHDYLAIPGGGPVQCRNESCQVNQQRSRSGRTNSGNTSEETLSAHESTDAVLNDSSNLNADDEIDEEVAAAAQVSSENVEKERNMVEIPLDCLNIDIERGIKRSNSALEMDEYERESPFQPFVRLTRLDVDNISQDIVEQEQNIRLSPVKGKATRQRNKSKENKTSDSLSGINNPETASRTKRQRKSSPGTLQEPTDPTPEKSVKVTPSKRQPRKPMGRRSKSLPKRNMEAYSAALAQEINNDNDNALNLQMEDSPEKEKEVEVTPPNNEKRAKRSSNKITPKRTVRPLILRKSGRKSQEPKQSQQEKTSNASRNVEKENDENVNIEKDNVRERTVKKTSFSLKQVAQLGTSSKPTKVKSSLNITEQIRRIQKRPASLGGSVEGSKSQGITKTKDRLTGMCTI